MQYVYLTVIESSNIHYIFPSVLSSKQEERTSGVWFCVDKTLTGDHTNSESLHTFFASGKRILPKYVPWYIRLKITNL